MTATLLTPLVVALTLRTPTQLLARTPISRRGFAASLGVAFVPASAIAEEFVMSSERRLGVQRKWSCCARAAARLSAAASIDAQTGMQMNQQFFESEYGAI